MGLNVGLTWLRASVLRHLSDLHLDGVWARIEAGGVLVAMLLVFFLPAIALALMLVMVLCSAILALVVRLIGRANEQRVRVRCVACGRANRPEASLCPGCKTECAPTRVLGAPGMVSRQFTALKRFIGGRSDSAPAHASPLGD